jgi:hypothetical protein
MDSSAQALVPFTGYYTFDAASGAFVMVDTNLIWNGAPQVSQTYDAKITISTDGITSQLYELGNNCTFENGRLTITGPDGSTIADLAFTKAQGVCSMQGTINGKQVAGTTPFGPIDLAMWNGTYYRQSQSPGPNGYTFSPALKIDADGTVQFAAAEGDPLQMVETYSYDFSMFVVAVTLQGKVQLYEMGTASLWGRVAGNATDGSVLVSLQLQVPAPHL